jgi:precorrin-2/cobalt-factor-2 C20-methyltransferase
LGDLRDTQVNYLSLILVHNPDRPRGPLQRGCRKRTPTHNDNAPNPDPALA